MSIGSVLDETWTLYTKFFLRFFVLALGVFLVVNLAYAALLTAVDRGSTGGSIVAVLATMLVGIVGLYWLQGTLIGVVVDVRDGKPDITALDAFRRALPYVGRLVGAGLLAGLGILGGFILLIVPGLILLTWWALITPAIVLEDRAIRDAFGRSRELVRGHGWTVFAIVLVTSILTSIAGGLLEAAFSALPLFLELLIGGTIANAAVAPFAAIALTLVFLRLREEKEGAPAEPASVEA